MTTTADSKDILFIENAIPPLRDGTYLLSAIQTIKEQTPGSFGAKATFVVSGERFAIAPAEIDSVFPPNLANGEFDGVFAHAVFNRRTLPWERRIDTPGSKAHYPDAPWLAVLVCDAQGAPELVSATAKDLVQEGAEITVQGSIVTGRGKLPADVLSYGKELLGELEYGETPDDPCTVIDLRADAFSQIAPAAADLAFLGHIREVDTSSGADSAVTSEQHAIVIASRVPAPNGVARAYLVSLEGMSDYLPAADGTPSTKIGTGIKYVRLITYQSWTFTVNDMDETLEKLLEGLNAGSPVSTLMLPVTGDVPTADSVARAMADQAAGSVEAPAATVLMQTALLMGYLPADHHLRHGGSTVSFYRGPFVPLGVQPVTSAPYYSGPDAANAYNPQTGMFDVSYGAAWQLGQLLALQSSGIANQLYEWKRNVTLEQAKAAEQALLLGRLGGAAVFTELMSRRAQATSNDPPPLPPEVVSWFGGLVTLTGVPFSYLVPDERMLPPESIRFFQIDDGWIDALIDGAFSIGRASVTGKTLETEHSPRIRRLARAAAGSRAVNRLVADQPPGPPVSGFLLRSQAVAGWPNLRVSGRDAAGPIDTVRITQLSEDTIVCLFNKLVASVLLREPPEQLHHGVGGAPGGYYATLRSVYGGPGKVAPGQQYPDSTQSRTGAVMRSDGRTVAAAQTAAAVKDKLSTDFAQSFPQGFTSAEYALELTKGVVEVEFKR